MNRQSPHHLCPGHLKKKEQKKPILAPPHKIDPLKTKATTICFTVYNSRHL